MPSETRTLAEKIAESAECDAVAVQRVLDKEETAAYVCPKCTALWRTDDDAVRQTKVCWHEVAEKKADFKSEPDGVWRCGGHLVRLIAVGENP